MTKSRFKFVLIGLVALSLMASCKKNNNGGTADGKGFKATTEQGGGDSKTHGVSGGGHLAVYWTAEDQIKIRNTSGTILTYELTDGAGGPDGIFYTGQDHDDFFHPNYVAAYPADYVSSMTANSVTFNLPATQQYQENSFGEGAAPMVAHSTSQTLRFKNVVGGLCIQLTDLVAKAKTVTKLEVVSLADEALWGTCTATFSGVDNEVSFSSITTSSSDAAKNTLTLDCGAGVSVTEYTKFYVMVPPGKLQSGFTLRVYSGLNLIYERSKSTGIPENFMSRNNVVTLNNVEIVGPTLTVTTGSPTNIEYNSARGNGTVVSGATPSSCGFIYALESNVTTPASELLWNSSNPAIITVTAAAPGTSFSAALTSLAANSIYWVRAWAKNETGAISYGNPFKFVTRDDYASKGGKLPKTFAIATGVYAYFSMGNLQYHASNPSYAGTYPSPPNTETPAAYSPCSGTWRYANQQYDFVGDANNHVSDIYDGWVDVFPWGTSGYNHGYWNPVNPVTPVNMPWQRLRKTGTNPDTYNYTPSQFRAYGYSGTNLNAHPTFADWAYNPISNGLNAYGISNKFTPSKDELETLLFSRVLTTRINGEAQLTGWSFAFAIINVNNVDVRGLMLFPDVFDWPDALGLDRLPTHINDNNGNIPGGNWGDNTNGWTQDPPFTTYTEAEWIWLERAGVVFLPCAGCWGGTGSMEWINKGGRYWTSSYSRLPEGSDRDQVYGFGLSPCHTTEGIVGITEIEPQFGFSVRLMIK